MAINLNTRYPDNTAGPTSNYPFGAARNDTVPGDATGTPLDKDWFNDMQAFFQGLMSRAGVTPSGSADTVLVSDLLNSLSAHSGRVVGSVQELVDIPAAARAGRAFVTRFYTVGGGAAAGPMEWRPSQPKSTANGGTIIDPDTVGGWDGTSGTLSAEYYGPSGQGTGEGNGCWVATAALDVVHLQGFGVVANGVFDDTTPMQKASNLSKPMTGEYGIYHIASPFTLNGNLHLQGADANQSTVLFSGTGTILTGDTDLRMTGGFKMTTSTNNITMVKVSQSRFWGDFSVETSGSPTGVTAVEWDTTTDIYQSAWLPVQCRDVAVANRITGPGSFNNNQLGADYSYWFTLIDFIRNEGTLVSATNTARGYLENSTNLLTQATGAGSFRDNHIVVWPDAVTNIINTAAGTTLAENHWSKIKPGDWTETGTGTVNVQVYEKKAAARVYLNAGDQTLPDNADTKVEFDAESWDEGACYTASPNFRWLAKRSARVNVHSQADISGNLANADRTLLQIFKNGILHTQAKEYVAGGVNGTRPEISDTVEVKKDDYIEIFAFADETAGANSHTIAAAATTTYATFEEI